MILTEEIMKDAGCCDPGVNRYFNDGDNKEYEASELLELAIMREDFGDAGYAISK